MDGPSRGIGGGAGPSSPPHFLGPWSLQLFLSAYKSRSLLQFSLINPQLTSLYCNFFYGSKRALQNIFVTQKVGEAILDISPHF